jgi:hypothetical protein
MGGLFYFKPFAPFPRLPAAVQRLTSALLLARQNKKIQPVRIGQAGFYKILNKKFYAILRTTLKRQVT